ncbi:hypothetical protein MhomT_04950 [Microbacterium hominis]|nr:hypothetical protein MhomT_04950 [Microbacterium hominis]
MPADAGDRRGLTGDPDVTAVVRAAERGGLGICPIGTPLASPVAAPAAAAGTGRASVVLALRSSSRRSAASATSASTSMLTSGGCARTMFLIAGTADSSPTSRSRDGGTGGVKRMPYPV